MAPWQPDKQATDGSDASIELPDDSCDLVVAGHVLEHVAKPVELGAVISMPIGSFGSQHGPHFD